MSLWHTLNAACILLGIAAPLVAFLGIRSLFKAERRKEGGDE